MAVPYGRKSRSRSRMQRAANMQYTAAGHTKCNNCSEPKAPHHICPSCGFYANRPAVKVVETA